jgi:hypothetical protein
VKVKEVGNISLYFMSIIAGVIIFIIGFTSHATEIDRKIAEQWTIFYGWVKAGGIKQAISAFRAMIGTTIRGILRNLADGFRNLPKRIGTFIQLIMNGFINLFHFILNFIQGIWNNFHWVGLIGIIILLFFSEYGLFINLELLIIVAFFFSFGVIFPYQERVANLVSRSSNLVLKQVVSAYSMLSGSKLQVTEAIYCSRCLRGIERIEFKSLREIKGKLNPPCPFCGFNSWIGYEYKPIYTQEKELAKTMIQSTEIGIQDVQKAVIAEKPSEVVPTEESVPIIDEKVIKKGKFPDYQSYKRAQDLGASNYSELKLIDRFGAPDFETAEKIRKGSFSHFQTFQKALELGASHVSELRLVEELNAPNLVTAKSIQKGNFPNYQAYKRAQDLGVSNYSDLELVDQLEAPDFETAEKIRKGGFSHFQAFQKALEVGASHVSELRLVEKLNAPDLETAKKIQKGRFPNYQLYQRAKDLGASNYAELELIDRVAAPDFETAEKISIEKTIPEISESLKCHNCGQYQKITWSYCPDCGADLQGQRQRELDLVNELKTLYDSSLIGRIIFLLQQLEEMPNLSSATFEIVRNFGNHSNYEIRMLANRILPDDQRVLDRKIDFGLKSVFKPSSAVASVHKAVRHAVKARTAEITKDKSDQVIPKPPQEAVITEEVIKNKGLRKLANLGLKLSVSNDAFKKWHEWFLRQTEKYQKSQITDFSYRSMMKKYERFLSQSDTATVLLTSENIQVLDEMLTLIHNLIIEFQEKERLD